MKTRNKQELLDTGLVDNLMFNKFSGGQKNEQIGSHLKPLKADATTFTTDATTARSLPTKGRSLAIYNNSGTLYAVTLGDDSSVVALASGVTDASGNVGIPCKPNDWTYVSCFDKQFVISQNASLLVFMAEDDTTIVER